MTLSLVIFLWWLSGYVGAIYFWTKDYDLTTEEVCLFSVFALMGPIMWITEFCNQTSHKPKFVWIKRRGKK